MPPVAINGKILARNAFLNFLGQAMPLVVGILSIPLIVRGLGADRFGLLSLTWVVVVYFTAVDLGMGRAATKYIAEALGKGNDRQISELLSTAVVIQGIFGSVGALVLYALTPLLVTRVLNISPELSREAQTTFYVLTLVIPIVLISNSFSGALEAAQRFDLVNAVRIPASTTTFVMPLVGLIWDLHLPGIVALILASRLVVLLVLMILDFRVFPEFKAFSVSRNLFAKLLRYGGWLTVTGLIAPLLVYIDRFLIASLISMAAVAYYTVPYEGITRLWIIPFSLTMTLFPAFSTLGGRGDRHRIGILFARSIKYTLLTLGPIVVLLAAFARETLQIWLGGDFPLASSTVLQLLAVGVLINSLGHVPYALLQGIGRPDITAKFHLLELPLYMGMAWFSIQHWGIAGAGAAWALRVLVDTILLFWATIRIGQIPFALLINKELKLSLITFSIFVGLVLGTKILANGLPLFLHVLFFGLIFTFFFWILWKILLDETDREVLFKMIRRSQGT